MNGNCAAVPSNENGSCEDGNQCTADSCDPTVGCVSAPDATTEGTECAAEGACAAAGVCHDAVCVPTGPSVDCDDGDPCTEDSCDDDNGCEYTTILDCEVPLCGCTEPRLFRL